MPSSRHQQRGRQVPGHLLRGRSVVAGEARGPALVLVDGLSFAMAFDPSTGTIRDVHSGAAGRSVTGCVMVMPSGRGSSSASTALAEAVRLHTAPAAIVLGEVDEILAVGSIVARRLYGTACPIVVLGETDRRHIMEGMDVTVLPDGSVIVGPASASSSRGAR